MYTVNQSKAKNDFYSCQVLTVVTSTDRYKNTMTLLQENTICSIGEAKGAAGHVLFFKYFKYINLYIIYNIYI